jgi:hypothetical protein
MTSEEEIAQLKKRCRELSIAFTNLDSERKFLRRNLANCKMLLEKAVECLRPYEGQDNVTEPPDA